MTDYQRNALDRAIERATAAGLSVIAQGRFKATNQKFFLVPSASDPTRTHIVRLVARNKLACDCPGAQNGWLCMHRAAAHVHLMAQTAEKRRREEEELEALLTDNRPISPWRV